MKTPTVSVIIPTYNRAQFLGQTLDSVLAQTFTDYEIIVVNDGSTDNTAEILANYAERIHIITLESNTGPSVTRNIALNEAQGEMIAFLDSDDLWYPNALSTLVACLRQNSELDLVCGAWDFIDEAGRTFGKANYPSRLTSRIHTDFLRTVAVGNPFAIHAMLIRKKCFTCCGVFDPSLRGVVDWDLWLRFAAHEHKIELLDVLVARWRRHGYNLTCDSSRMEQASRQVITKLFSDPQWASRITDLREHAYMFAWLSIAGFCQEVGREADVRKYVRMAEELYCQAPQNPELSLHYLGRLFKLPETESFMQRIMASIPRTKPLYHWLTLRRSLYNKKYWTAFIILSQLVTYYPDWPIILAEIPVYLTRSRFNQSSLRAIIMGLAEGLFKGPKL